MKILYDSSELIKAINDIYSISDDPNNRRVAIVAYIGAGARKFIRNPNGLEIICKPQPGSTDPDTINYLIREGANIRFSDKLHSKVYWSTKGCIITSANLSANAFSGKQLETGVLIESNELDVNKLIDDTDSYDINKNNMKNLYIGTRKLAKLLDSFKRNVTDAKKEISFLEWYLQPIRNEWKIGWWEEEGEFSEAAKKISNKEYKNTPYDCLNIKDDQVVDDDMLLCFRIVDNNINSFEWMYVDFVVKVPKNDKAYEKDYSCQAVQVYESKRYIKECPFAITEEFKKAFVKAAREYGINKIKCLKLLVPDEELIDLIKKHLQTH